MSRSADELQQGSQLVGVQIDQLPSSPHESWNPDKNIVARPSTPNQRALLDIQNVDTDAGAGAPDPIGFGIIYVIHGARLQSQSFARPSRTHIRAQSPSAATVGGALTCAATSLR